MPPAPEGGWSDEIGAIQMKLLEITSRVRKLSGTAVEAIADSTITNAEFEARGGQAQRLNASWESEHAD